MAEDGPVSLRDLFEVQLVALRTLIDSQAEKVTVALTAADKAVAKAEIATEKRFDSVNEFRGALTELSSMMATRRELEATLTVVNLRIDGLAAQVSALTSRIDSSEGKSKGITSSFGAMVAAVSLVVIVVNVVLYAISRG